MNKYKQMEYLREIMVAYQEKYEMDRSNIWLKENSNQLENIEKLSGEIYEKLHEYSYAAQNLGFVQGMNFALDVMNISGTGENKEQLEKFLRSIELNTSEEK